MWVDLNSVIYLFSGVFLGVVLILVWQYTWRKNIVKSFEINREKQRFALNQTFDLIHLEPNLIIEFDVLGELQFANLSACKHLSLHKGDWATNRFIRFVREHIPEVLEKGERVQRELSYKNRHYILYITPFKGVGVGRVHVYAIDVTDMQETYVQLEEEKERAIEASRVKSEFLANMSHELRTPMNGIISLSELLKSQSLPKDAKNYAETIFSSGQTLLSILNDILDISKVESGGLILENTCFDLHKLMIDLRKLYKPIAHKKNIEIVLDISEDVPRYMKGDAGRLLQVLRNLVGNAIKFTKYGEVLLSVTLLKEDDADRVYFVVKDTGIGIPPDKLEDIFDKFTQADASVTREYGGTGLGLAITKELVTLMNGEIYVKSKEGFGSTFSFYVSLFEIDEKDIPLGMLESEDLDYDILLKEDVSILAVDDTEMNLFCLERVLNDLGVKIIDKAYNGEEALALMNSVHYDIVFMDCMMPIMDGYQATEIYREYEDTSDGLKLHQVIIAMTANAMAGDREKSLKSGMDDHISKPIRSEVIKHKLAQWLPDERYERINKVSIEEDSLVEDSDTLKHIFNKKQLDMFCGDDRDLELEILNMFLEQSYEILIALDGELDDEEWSSLVHKLKGISGNCGATSLFELSENAQFAEREDRLEWFERLKKAYGELCTHFINTYGDDVYCKSLYS